MTFEEALKRLTEKEPEKFKLWNVSNTLCLQSNPDVEPYLDGSDATQDDIDAILAEIGWEYEVNHTHDQRAWTAWIWRIEDYVTLNGNYTRRRPSKLEAAKAALIAVVEREYPK